MTPDQTQKIREIQAVLQSIDCGTPKFFNVTLYVKLGLVTCKKKWGNDSVGNKAEMGHTFHLTPKAKAYLNVVV